MPTKATKKATKSTKTTKDTKAKTTGTAKSTKAAAKSVNTPTAKAAVKSVNAPARTKRAASTTKSATAASQAVNDARESNRLRQQRFLEKHRDEINEKRRERYAERKEGGQCPRCGKKLVKSSKNTLCKDCLEKARDYNQR